MTEKLKFGIALIGGSLLIAGTIIFSLTMRLEENEGEKAAVIAKDMGASWAKAEQERLNEVPEDWPAAEED